jgi:hypothetical protein
MVVSVVPDQFQFVMFDAGAIAAIGTALMERLGLNDRDLEVVVDETTPLTRITVATGPTVVVSVESGAFEDTRKPRHLSERAVETSLGRVLVRARDRMDGSFGDAPPDDELTVQQVAAWDASAIGRLSRLGFAAHQQRWRYNFRNRHGFADSVDAAFDALWNAERLTFAQLCEISDSARESATIS